MLAVFQKLKWFFVREKKSYFAMLILIIMLSFISTLPPYLLGLAIDELIKSNTSLEYMLYVIIAVLFVAFGSYFLSRTFNILINKKGQQLMFELRKQYFDKMFELDSKLFEEYTKGDLVSRMTQDMEYLKYAATTLLQEIIFSGSNILFTFIIMIFVISPILTLTSAIVIPLGLFFILSGLQKKRKYYEKHRKVYSEMTESLLESVEGAKVIKAYIQEENDVKKMHKEIEKDISSWKYIVKFESFYAPFMDFTVAIAFFLGNLFGSILVITGKISAGEFITFSMYLTMLSGPIINLSNVLQQINQAITSKDRLYEILELEPEVKNEQTLPIIEFDSLEFNDAVFKYPFDQEPTIKGLSFKITKGQTVGIVGPTGSGKSTIIRQLLREFNIHQGVVTINGKSIREYELEDVRNLIGYVPQSHILFRGNIVENLLVGKQSVEDYEMQRAMEIADFKKDVEFMVDGLQTSVGEFGSGLSGGQKQRLSIARAVLKDPEILILDDSLSAVDANTEKTIINQLQKERGDKTNIIVAHRFSAVRKADIILVIQDGNISESGTHQQLMDKKGWYFQQYNYQINSLNGGENNV